MTAVLEHILTSTDAKPTGPDKFFGHGPCHGSQRHRDLSIRVTSDRILLYCFAGCELKNILSALGLTVKDLFFDSRVDPSEIKKQRARRVQERRHKTEIEAADGLTIDALREADYFIRSRHRLDISHWSHAHLDAELNALADAHTLLEYEDLDGLR